MNSARAAWGCLIFLLILVGCGFFGWRWLLAHPQHNPAATLTLSHPQGWATHRKLIALVDDPDACFALLDRADIRYDRRPVVGEGACRTDQRMTLVSGATFPALSPTAVAPSCAITAALILWNRDVVQPLAQRHFGQRVAKIENLGSYSCRTIGGGPRQSEHSTANAIDISAFVLADGRRISVLKHWDGDDDRAAFLHDVRSASCDLFSTVLSPDYNDAHADHFHLDQAVRGGGWSLCR